MIGMKRISALFLCGALLLAGCSQAGGANGNSRGNVGQATAGTADEAQNGNGTQSGDSTQNGDGSQSDDGTQNGADNNGSDGETSPAPTTATLSSEREYSDAQRNVSILGLQEYKKLKTDSYTDKAKKGKVFLVLFLQIYNKGIEKEYFNVNYLNARVDGREIENTFLLNEPEGYPTVFANIQAGETAEGFIVWEVPEDWKKMEVDYHGWRDSDGISLACSLTRKDLKKPEKYEK